MVVGDRGVEIPRIDQLSDKERQVYFAGDLSTTIYSCVGRMMGVIERLFVSIHGSYSWKAKGIIDRECVFIYEGEAEEGS